MKSCTGKNLQGKTVTVKIGDYVGFKADVEQTGKVTKISRGLTGHYNLTVKNLDGFPGDYLRYATVTSVPLDRTWEEYVKD